MGTITDQIAAAFRDFVTEGVSASGEYEVEKAQVRALGPLIETAIGQAGLAALVSVTKTTRALLDADLAHNANAVALVYADGTAANNDLYVKSGASGSGSWANSGALNAITSELTAVPVAAAEASADAAEASADAAQASAGIAEAFAGPTFANQAAGEAATTTGEYFAVDASGIVTIYLRTGGGSTAQRVMLTTAALAAVGGAGMVGMTGGGTVQDFANARVILSADRDYYVRTDGSDSNTGLANSAGGAFLTLQKAVDAAYALDCRGKRVTINVADGNYNGAVVVSGPLLNGRDGTDAPLRIIGNETTPANVTFSATSANALSVTNHAVVLLAGVKCQVSTSGIGWSVSHGARLYHRNCRIGDCADEAILYQQQGALIAKGTLTIDGDSDSFIHGTKRGLADFAGQTIAFSGTRVFATYLWGLNDASLNLDGATITRTATVTGGITVHNDATLNASGLTGSYLGGSAPQVDDGGRIIVSDLIDDRIFYVRSTGNDNNDGLVNTDARAFATITGAITAIAKREYNPRTWGTYDTVTDNCTIQVANDTYNETIKLRDLKAYMGCTIKGDEATPANVTINGVSDGIIGFALSTKWALKGVKLTAAGGSDIRLTQGTVLTFQNVNFGAATGGYHMQLEEGAIAVATGNYTISGAAGAHVLMRQSKANLSGRTVTITGTPAFANAFAYLECGSSLRVTGMTFSGSATGQRYQANGLSVIDTNAGGATYLPGNSAGATGGGGQYV